MTETVGFLMLIGIFVLAIAALVLFLWALVSVINDLSLTPGGKAIWALLIFAFPILGPLFWFIWGRNQGIRY